MARVGAADDDRMLKGDRADLFAATVALGMEVDEFDADTGLTEKRWRRTEGWREALNAIRRCVAAGVRVGLGAGEREWGATFAHGVATLHTPYPPSQPPQKHHKHELLPARKWLAEFSTLESHLLPLASSHPHDTDMLYILAKVLIFMTEQPGPGTEGTIEVHMITMRGALQMCGWE